MFNSSINKGQLEITLFQRRASRQVTSLTPPQCMVYSMITDPKPTSLKVTLRQMYAESHTHVHVTHHVGPDYVILINTQEMSWIMHGPSDGPDHRFGDHTNQHAHTHTQTHTRQHNGLIECCKAHFLMIKYTTIPRGYPSLDPHARSHTICRFCAHAFGTYTHETQCPPMTAQDQ